VELAVATNTAPADWWDEPDEVVATAVDVLNKQAEKMRERRRRRGRS
jgi:hypothetical protein